MTGGAEKNSQWRWQHRVRWPSMWPAAGRCPKAFNVRRHGDDGHTFSFIICYFHINLMDIGGGARRPRGGMVGLLGPDGGVHDASQIPRTSEARDHGGEAGGSPAMG